MKTFKQFLKETPDASNDATECAVNIFKNCASFLKQAHVKFNAADILRSTGILWRGMKGIEGGGCVRLAGNRERKPSDTNLQLHHILDTYLQRHFGFPYRSRGIFCSNSPVQAQAYAPELYMIFPIGDFSCVWSDTIYDAYNDLDNSWHGDGLPQLLHTILHDMGVQEEDYVGPHADRMADYDAWYSLVGQWLEKTSPYKDSNLKEVLAEHADHPGFGREIMLRCNEYYALNVKFAGDVLQIIEELKK